MPVLVPLPFRADVLPAVSVRIYLYLSVARSLPLFLVCLRSSAQSADPAVAVVVVVVSLQRSPLGANPWPIPQDLLQLPPTSPRGAYTFQKVSEAPIRASDDRTVALL